MIVATGDLPDLEQIQGAELCTSSWDAISGNVLLGEKVIIYDGTGRHSEPIVAERVRQAGKSFNYVMVNDVLTKELSYAESVIWRKHFAVESIVPLVEFSLR